VATLPFYPCLLLKPLLYRHVSDIGNNIFMFFNSDLKLRTRSRANAAFANPHRLMTCCCCSWDTAKDLHHQCYETYTISMHQWNECTRTMAAFNTKLIHQMPLPLGNIGSFMIFIFWQRGRKDPTPLSSWFWRKTPMSQHITMTLHS